MAEPQVAEPTFLPDFLGVAKPAWTLHLIDCQVVELTFLPW